MKIPAIVLKIYTGMWAEIAAVLMIVFFIAMDYWLALIAFCIGFLVAELLWWWKRIP